MHPEAASPPLNLRRRFALYSLGVIAVIALGLGWLMSHMLTQRMLQREGEVSMDFIQNLLLTDQSASYLANPGNEALKARFLGSMSHLSSMSDPVRANAYQSDGTVVWSTDAALVGRHFPVNDELREALAGRLVVHNGRLDSNKPGKEEHVGLAARTSYYVESYIPILEPGTRKVLGVMELYKVPVQLSAAIRDALLQLWLACALSAIGLFATLYWTVARADRVMRDQQARLAENQTLSTAVELARAVAHNLRNPLASIRVSAEMLQTGDVSPQDLAEHSGDITAAVDRADRWITELVRVSQAPQLQSEVVQPAQLVLACMQEMAPEFNRRGIRWTVQAGDAPAIQAHTAMLRQILISILANAADVMPEGGEIDVRWSSNGKELNLRVIDNGPGIREDVRQALFRPFFSTKSGGLGIGLVLVKRMVEQWGGQVALTPAPLKGTCVELTLPLAPVTQPQKE
ncbi:MAG: sensor histidine kinase [Comamonadaceae bacterium]|nr:HAMP domain-containing histidine kinase [Rhodoferax sp.]TSA15594.1 MAG: sensor histidine kinase [Comamonadaceae bacterium]